MKKIVNNQIIFILLNPIILIPQNLSLTVQCMGTNEDIVVRDTVRASSILIESN